METIQDFTNILKSFSIRADVVNHQRLDHYFYFDVRLQPHAKVKELSKFGDEISLALKTPAKPNIKLLHQEGLVRMEFVTPRNSTLKLLDLFTNHNIPKGEIMCLLGQKLDGHHMWMDLSQNPHMLVSGTTGSGKSTLLHNIIANLMNYNDVELSLIDAKHIEFVEYEKNFNNVQVMYTYEDALEHLHNMIELMEFRYTLIRAGRPNDFKPEVVIIDEFADLIMQDEKKVFYGALCRLAQKCRAAKIHLILATQRPSVDIVNGTIKANFPARIACRTASHVDSKVILDASGAENLLGKGDALVRDNFRFLERFQVAYTDAFEVFSVFGNKDDN